MSGSNINRVSIAQRVFYALKNNRGALELHYTESNGPFDFGYRKQGDTKHENGLDVTLFRMIIDDGATYPDEQVQFWPKPFTTEEKLLHRDKNNQVCEFMEEQIVTLGKNDFHNPGTLILTNQIQHSLVSVAAVDTITEIFRSRRIAYQLSHLDFGSFDEKPNRVDLQFLHLVIWRRYASRNMSFQFYKNSSRTGDESDKSLIFTSKKYPCFVVYPVDHTFHIRELMAITDENHEEVLMAIGDPIEWALTPRADRSVFWENLDNLYLRKNSEQLQITQASDLMGIEVNLMRTHLTDETLALQLKHLTLAQIRTYVMGFLRRHGYPFELINSGMDRIGLEAGTGTRWISIAISKEIDGYVVPMDFPTDTPLSKFVIYTMDSSGGIQGIQAVQYVDIEYTVRALVDSLQAIINHYLDREFLNPQVNFPTAEADEDLPEYSEEEEDSLQDVLTPVDLS